MPACKPICSRQQSTPPGAARRNEAKYLSNREKQPLQVVQKLATPRGGLPAVVPPFEQAAGRGLLERMPRRAPGASLGRFVPAGSAAVAISANGRYILYYSAASNLTKNDTNGVRDAFVHDGWTFLTRRISIGEMGGQANAPCSGTALSASGRFAVFNTTAGNLVPGDTNAKSDVFLADLAP